MSVDIYVTPPPGLPDPQEPISSFARAPGNIMMAPEVLGMPSLDDITARDHAVMVLAQVIAELDKGDTGKFSDQWCADADMRWSGGREMNRAWMEISPFVLDNPNTPPSMRSRETNWGHMMRDRLRRDAMRFLLYYLAGYEIRWSS